MNRMAMIVRRSNSCDAALGASSVARWSGMFSGCGSGARMTASSPRRSGEDDVEDDDQGQHDAAEDGRRLPPGVALAGLDARAGLLVGQRPREPDQLGV